MYNKGVKKKKEVFTMSKHTKDIIKAFIHGAGCFTMFVFILAKCCHLIEADWAVVLVLAFSPYILAGVLGALCLILAFILSLFDPKGRD